MSEVLVPYARVSRWIENFVARHGEASLEVVTGALSGRAADGSTFLARPPLGRAYAGPADAEAFAEACAPSGDWGVLLVRKGGFAVARVSGEQVVDSKVGRRHVQGRTKAGGQSQQRFSRRRENQARVAYAAAADHAARVLEGLGTVVTGGDRAGLDAVLSDRRLAGLTVLPPVLAVADPRRSVLDQAVRDALSVRVDVTNLG
jgi:hypothetical protein